MTDLDDEHNSNGADASADSGYEKGDVSVGKILLATVAAVIFLVVVIVMLGQFFIVETEEQVQQVVLAPESVTLRELRAREDKALNSYGIIDTTQGIYRIPIERAMKLQADEAFRKRTANEESQ
jgi:hypothetical protein